MAGIVGLLPYIWRAYWRGIRSRKAWAGTNLAIVTVLGLIALPGHFAGCIFAAVRMRSDPGGQGALLTELLLLGLFTAWLLLPIFSTGIQARGQSFSPHALMAFPLTLRQLFLVGTAGALVQPIYWILIIASALCLLPLAAAPNPLFGVSAGLLFTAFCALISWGIILLGNAVFVSRRGREIALSLMSLLLFSIIFLAQLDFDASDGRLAVEGLGHRLLLMSADGREGLLVHLRHWTPAAWTAQAAQGRILALASLILATGLSAALSLWSLERSLNHPPSVGAKSRGKLRAVGSLPGLPPALGAAARKEWRYLTRTMDAWFSFAISLGASVWLLIRPDAPLKVLLFGVFLTMVMVLAIPLNCFGLDRRAVDRYRLLPLTGGEVLLSKNIAYALLTAVQLAPLVLAGAYRFGIALGLAALCGAASYLLLLVLWGNLLSLRVPAPREFFNFDSKEQAGGIIGQLYALAVAGPPALTALLCSLAGPAAIFLGQAVLLAICLGIYRALLPRAGQRFEASAEIMRDRLAS